MDIVIITASPREVSQSKSAVFAAAISEGIARTGMSSQIFFLSDRTQWKNAEEAFLKGKYVLFVLPVFCGGLPSTFIEFAERLARCLTECPEDGRTRKIAFVVHAGLPGSGDFGFCARYLRTLPPMLGGVFSGVIGFGDTTTIGYLEAVKTKMIRRLHEAGEEYARNACSFSSPVAFWGPEDMAEKESEAYCRFINRFCRHVARAQGCDIGLDDRPYNETD